MDGNFTPQESGQVRPSFDEALRLTRQQVEAHCVSIEDKPLMQELCMIIAEVYTFSPEYPMKIAGCYKSAGLVKEIFNKLRNWHLDSVIYTYQRIPYEIKNVKAYLRTALYNSVFEFEAKGINDFNHSYKYSAKR